MSPARWFTVPYFVMSHFIGGIFAFPLALMFLNYAVKRRAGINMSASATDRP
jgi:hypothetical protein